MNKRILSMLLALCMVLVAVPVFALTVLAADDAVTHTVMFRLPDGTVVVSREVEEGPTTIDLPTEEETNAVLDTYNEKVDAAYRLTYSDILGYYEITPSGEYKSAKAYETFLLEDKEFYTITDKSVFNRSINWPLYTSQTSFDGYRGSWTLASYQGASDKFVTFYSMDKTHDIINTGNTWSNGGLYLGSDPHLATTTDASAALVWRALAPGKVNVDMNYIGFTSTNGAGSVSDIAMAIAKNGTIVWPASAAGKTLSETWSTAGSGATLLLQDRIRLKLIIDLQTGADMLDGDLYLEYGIDAGFAGAEKALLLQRGNEGDDKSNAHLKATLDILPTAFAATMYFRVVTAEGTVVSSTLTYSVSSYAARSTEDAALTAAILALGKAAENYGG